MTTTTAAIHHGRLASAGVADSFLVEMNAPDPLGPTGEEIVAAVDEATLPGERILDEKWSEYDWGATGLGFLFIEIVAAYGGFRFGRRVREQCGQNVVRRISALPAARP